MSDQYSATPSPGYGPPAYGPPYSAPRNSNDAVIALVAAIVSWVICPIVPAVVALVYAGRAQQAITASGGALGGQSMVTGARVIAGIHLVLAAVFLVFVLVAVFALR
jgi:hypothetical protein